MPSIDASRGANAFAAALGWLEVTMLGTIATTVAIIAVGWIGFIMITGWMDFRRAAQVVLGCFIIFGASTVASGIMGAFSGTIASTNGAQTPPPPPLLPSPPATARAPAIPYDPYAGAALPPR